MAGVEIGSTRGIADVGSDGLLFEFSWIGLLETAHGFVELGLVETGELCWHRARRWLRRR